MKKNSTTVKGYREIQGTKRKKREYGLRETQSARELLYRSAGKSPCALSVATSSSARAGIPRSRRLTSRRIIPCDAFHPRQGPTPETSYVIIQILLTFLYHIAPCSVGRQKQWLNAERELATFPVQRLAMDDERKAMRWRASNNEVETHSTSFSFLSSILESLGRFYFKRRSNRFVYCSPLVFRDYPSLRPLDDHVLLKFRNLAQSDLSLPLSSIPPPLLFLLIIRSLPSDA